MELKHFRLIKTIAEEGSIANSSEKLFLTQSALSHQLRALEEQLGFKVFYRSRNQWELSEQGQELYKLALGIFESMEKSFDTIRYINEGAKGRVRISTECYSFYQGLPTFIQKMRVLYPDIEVDFILDATLKPIEKLLTNDIDIAIVPTPADSPALSSIEVSQDEVFCIMNKEHPFAYKPYVEAQDFEHMHLLIHSFPLETVSVHEFFLKLHKVTPQKISAVPFLTVTLEMVAANMGITCIPKWLFKSIKASDQLVLKPIGANGLKRVSTWYTEPRIIASNTSMILWKTSKKNLPLILPKQGK